MKILHVNTYPSGGAFTGAYRLHEALLNNGVESKMLVSKTPENYELKEVFTYNKKFRRPDLHNRILPKIGLPITEYQKRKYLAKRLEGDYEIISFPFSDVDITKSEAYYNSDIVNLHWIAGFVDYEKFFKKCTKPVVITLRDLNPIQGIFHYEEDKIRNITLSHLEKKYYDLKISYTSKFKGPIVVVGISEWITEMSRRSMIFKNLRHYTIHNCINTENYDILKKKKARAILNIPNDSIVLSFVSDNNNTKRKGIDLIQDAVAGLSLTSNLVILTVGKGTSNKFPLRINHRHLGQCSQAEICIINSASDALILPSREEALGNVMLEAMACGTPVIGTPVGGLLDVIKPGFNGLFSKDVTAEGLKEAIVKFINTKDNFNPMAIRKYIEENFNEELIAGKYIRLYRSILDKN